MKKILPFVVLAGLVGCSSVPQKVSTYAPRYSGRHIASVDKTLNSPVLLRNKAQKLMNGIFHGYMIGQIHLYEFDKALDQAPEKAMKSAAYHTLLAVRAHVDQFEHDLNEFYLDLVMATALPHYSEEHRKNAQETLDVIGDFMAGLKTDKSELPENLKPLILGNLREKQTELYEELKALRDDSTVTGNDLNVKRVIQDNMVLLRATRMSYFKDLKNYEVDEKLLKDTIAQEKSKKSYKNLVADIKKLSEEMKKFTSELGRGTSSDTIFPSAGANGNISGKSYPANTWSLTYDDGPGRTTPQVVNNLKDRDIPATFFMLAKQVEGNPNTSKMIKDAGFDIASHSYTHAQLTKVGPEQLEREIGTAKKVIESKFGKTLTLFRLPYGAGVSVSKVRAKIAEHKLIHVFWTVDTLDWQDKNPQSIFNRTLKQMNASGKNAGIILFHDIHQQSVTASTMLMDHFNQKKLTVCTVQGVVDQINKGLPSCK